MKRREFLKKALPAMGIAAAAPVVLEQGLGSAMLGAGSDWSSQVVTNPHTAALTADDIATATNQLWSRSIQPIAGDFHMILHPSHEKDLSGMAGELGRSGAETLDRLLLERLDGWS